MCVSIFKHTVTNGRSPRCWEFLCFTIFSSVIIILSFETFAAEPSPPSFILLYHGEDIEKIETSCDQLTQGVLNCNFVQTRVELKAEPDDLQESLDQIEDNFVELVQDLERGEKACKDLSKASDILSNMLSEGTIPTEILGQTVDREDAEE